MKELVGNGIQAASLFSSICELSMSRRERESGGRLALGLLCEDNLPQITLARSGGCSKVGSWRTTLQMIPWDSEHPPCHLGTEDQVEPKTHGLMKEYVPVGSEVTLQGARYAAIEHEGLWLPTLGGM